MRCTPRSADGPPAGRLPCTSGLFSIAPGRFRCHGSASESARLEEERTQLHSAMTKGTPVAIFNSHGEFIDALREALDREGLPTVTALLPEIQSGALDLVAFLETHDPQVIVYDLPRPFEKHWNFLRLLRQTAGLKKRTWILTTIDKAALDAAVGASGVIEVVLGEPYGVADVVDAVHHALRGGHLRKA